MKLRMSTKVTIALTCFAVAGIILTQWGALQKPAQVAGVTNNPITQQSPEVAKTKPVDDLLGKLSYEEKVGQLFILSLPSAETTDERIDGILALHPGGIIVMGDNNRTQLLQISTRIKSVSQPVVPFIAIDQEGGLVKRFNEDPIPAPQELGKQKDQVCAWVTESTRWLSELGFTMNFGIVADIGWEENDFISKRSYGNNAQHVSEVVASMVDCSYGLINTVKHFPGHGRTDVDSHVALPIIALSENEWKETDAVPFQTAIDKGVQAIMMGHMVYPDIASEPASLSPYWVQKVRELGFSGLVITDDLSMLEHTYTPEEAVWQAFLAGNDMLLFVTTPDVASAAASVLQTKIRAEGKEKELDRRVRHILEMKSKYTSE